MISRTDEAERGRVVEGRREKVRRGEARRGGQKVGTEAESERASIGEKGGMEEK